MDDKEYITYLEEKVVTLEQQLHATREQLKKYTTNERWWNQKNHQLTTEQIKECNRLLSV